MVATQSDSDVSDSDVSNSDENEDQVANIFLMAKEEQVQEGDTKGESLDEVDYSYFLTTLEMNWPKPWIIALNMSKSIHTK